MQSTLKKTSGNVIRIIDEYNDQKVWIIRHYSCGHYFFNQENKGQILNENFTKTTRKYLKSLGLKV